MGVPKRRLLVIVTVGLVAALSPLLVLEGTVAYRSLREYLHRRPFDSAAWRDLNQVDGSDPVRIRMVDDLVKSHRLDHLSRAEVENLLGHPTKTEYFHDHDLVYWLGPERGFMGIDSEWLVIDLDERSVVRKYAVVRD